MDAFLDLIRIDESPEATRAAWNWLIFNLVLGIFAGLVSGSLIFWRLRHARLPKDRVITSVRFATTVSTCTLVAAAVSVGLWLTVFSSYLLKPSGVFPGTPVACFFAVLLGFVTGLVAKAVGVRS